MEREVDWWRVSGPDIIDSLGDTVRMRGVCLGGWMNMENSIAGYPGNESGVRQAIAELLGEDQARFFFERYLDYFLTEDDLRYIASLGMNVVRVALNYHHFETDEQPFEYREAGFTRLDRLLGWARKHGLHVVLDLHAVPGWQNPGWHCDNPGHRAHFWDQKGFEDRAIALWHVLATRYRDDVTVAGYNLLNEPVASPAQLPKLHRYYRRATHAIRTVDTEHIIFLEGNYFGQRCDQLEAPFDDNTVYSYHFYPEPVLDAGQYPVTIEGNAYDRAWLMGVLSERASFMRDHKVPAWAGEFGAIFPAGADDVPRVQVINDMIEIMEQLGHHWTLWHYKDIGPMGIVVVDPDTPWMERTRHVRSLKTMLRCDYWIERFPTDVSDALDSLIHAVERTASPLPDNLQPLAEDIFAAVCQDVLSQRLLPAFAQQFRDISNDEIDHTMQSFKFENCRPREALANALRAVCALDT